VTATPLGLFAEENVPQFDPVQPGPEADQVTALPSDVDGVIASAWLITIASRAGETVTETGGFAMVKLNVADAFCAGTPESVTEKVSDNALAVAEGVPASVPVEEARVSPAGSVPWLTTQL
jgi:hypothetical protein